MVDMVPIAGDLELKQVPAALFTGHEKFCQLVAGCSVKELSRGLTPLSTSEAVAILEDRPYKRMLFPLARERLKELMAAHTASHAEPRAVIREALGEVHTMQAMADAPGPVRYKLNKLAAILERGL